MIALIKFGLHVLLFYWLVGNWLDKDYYLRIFVFNNIKLKIKSQSMNQKKVLALEKINKETILLAGSPGFYFVSFNKSTIENVECMNPKSSVTGANGTDGPNLQRYVSQKYMLTKHYNDEVNRSLTWRRQARF